MHQCILEVPKFILANFGNFLNILVVWRKMFSIVYCLVCSPTHYANENKGKGNFREGDDS